jgi:hypothetical protein
MDNQIPVIEARGSHHQVGHQIGEGCRTQIQGMLAGLQEGLPAGIKWSDLSSQQGRLSPICVGTGGDG